MNGGWSLLAFDWDGTLVDSAPAIVADMQRAIVDLGLPTRTDVQIADLIGLDILDGLKRLYPELEFAALLKRLIAYRASTPAPVSVAPLFAGAAQALHKLLDAGYRLGVATGRQRRSLDRELAGHAEVAPLFTWTRCADETRAKPHPAMLQSLCTAAQVAPDRVLMVGDTEYDIAMAAAAGVAAVGVATGSHDDARLLQAGALAVLPSVAELPQWLSTAPD
ncbi:MAG: HAD family hydrolase [Nevskiaceae bacterium]|nr:MAG: HAD family hydrolase [Nevskiaceae bacterium]TBR73324.1 MAG: HAD family hydrolase [Nevskiaceae bacterium]